MVSVLALKAKLSAALARDVLLSSVVVLDSVIAADSWAPLDRLLLLHVHIPKSALVKLEVRLREDLLDENFRYRCRAVHTPNNAIVIFRVCQDVVAPALNADIAPAQRSDARVRRAIHAHRARFLLVFLFDNLYLAEFPQIKL